MASPAFIYSLKKNFFKERPHKFENILPWAFIDDDSIVHHKDHAMSLTCSYRGPDMDSSTQEELLQYMSSLNNAFKRFGTGTVLYLENQRRHCESYVSSEMPSPVQQLMEDERANYFSDKHNNKHFENHYFFTFYYTPPSFIGKKITRLFIEHEKNKQKKNNTEKDLELYKKMTDSFRSEAMACFSMLQHLFKDIRILTPQETVTYLHSTISDRFHPVNVNPSLYITDYITDTGLMGGRTPKLGKNWMKIISLLDYPPMTTPGLFDDLNGLGFEYRWVTRFICLDKQDAKEILEQTTKNWSQQGQNIFSIMKETITQIPNKTVDQEAVSHASDSAEAQGELGSDLVSFGYLTMTLIIMDEDKNKCETKANMALELINSKGFTGRIEDDNAVEAYSGSLIGLYKANIRRALVNSLNFCHLAPTSSIWSGDEYNQHLQGPVLLYTNTYGSTPFRLSLHDGDIGHTLIVGPTGSGKSVLLNTIEAHFGKYKDANVFIFDKAASSRALTLSVGGNFYNLAVKNNELSFQPLADVDNDQERLWALEWLINYLNSEGFEVKVPHKNIIDEALKSIALLDKNERTISNLSDLIQDRQIRENLYPLTLRGSYGTLFDSRVDRFGEGRWQVFEMETLMQNQSIVSPTLQYLFHRLERFISENPGPSIMVLDECWLFLSDPLFQNKLREYFKDMRKKNTSIIVATQNLSDITRCQALADTILDNCPNRIYLPNPNAINDQNAELYRSFGLNDSQIQIIASIQKKKDYYYASATKGNRTFSLALQPSETPFVTATSKEDQKAINYILSNHNENELSFPERWLMYKVQGILS